MSVQVVLVLFVFRGPPGSARRGLVASRGVAGERDAPKAQMDR